MKPAGAKSRFGKLKIAHAIFALAVLAGAGGYGWRVYSLFRDAQVDMPQPQIEKLVKDLRLFHSRNNRFPANFDEINNLIWHTQPKPNYGIGSRQALSKNYHYFFTCVDDQTCAIWALPIGPRRYFASSFFLALKPGWVRIWKGIAFEDEAIRELPAIPRPDQLAGLMMQELPSRTFMNQK
ncbi:MAG TPA: hypothetical protein VKD91_18410 [Pyrinomonadaceae bacterium]|nr:hypothetical protein [Pyrinomonadaceae bacterium]